MTTRNRTAQNSFLGGAASVAGTQGRSAPLAGTYQGGLGSNRQQQQQTDITQLLDRIAQQSGVQRTGSFGTQTQRRASNAGLFAAGPQNAGLFGLGTGAAGAGASRAQRRGSLPGVGQATQQPRLGDLVAQRQQQYGTRGSVGRGNLAAQQQPAALSLGQNRPLGQFGRSTQTLAANNLNATQANARRRRGSLGYGQAAATTTTTANANPFGNQSLGVLGTQYRASANNYAANNYAANNYADQGYNDAAAAYDWNDAANYDHLGDAAHDYDYDDGAYADNYAAGNGAYNWANDDGAYDWDASNLNGNGAYDWAAAANTNAATYDWNANTANGLNWNANAASNLNWGDDGTYRQRRKSGMF